MPGVVTEKKEKKWKTGSMRGVVGWGAELQMQRAAACWFTRNGSPQLQRSAQDKGGAAQHYRHNSRAGQPTEAHTHAHVPMLPSPNTPRHLQRLQQRLSRRDDIVERVRCCFQQWGPLSGLLFPIHLSLRWGLVRPPSLLRQCLRFY